MPACPRTGWPSGGTVRPYMWTGCILISERRGIGDGTMQRDQQQRIEASETKCRGLRGVERSVALKWESFGKVEKSSRAEQVEAERALGPCWRHSNVPRPQIRRQKYTNTTNLSRTQTPHGWLDFCRLCAPLFFLFFFFCRIYFYFLRSGTTVERRRRIDSVMRGGWFCPANHDAAVPLALPTKLSLRQTNSGFLS
jgi:hypothetical protein